VTAPLAVALFDIVMVVPLVDTMVVPAGMPVPVMGCPVISPVRLETDVIVSLPLVTTPVGLTTLEAVAFADMVIVFPLAAEMVVPDGIPVPVIGCPTTTPVKLDTFATVGLPEVTMPVGATVVEAEALFEMVSVLLPTAVMYVLAGMLVPVMGCPTANPETLDMVFRVVLPETRIPVIALLAVFVTAVTAAAAPAGMPTPDRMLPTAGAFVSKNA
jgi:hypothetical protein